MMLLSRLLTSCRLCQIRTLAEVCAWKYCCLMMVKIPCMHRTLKLLVCEL